MSKYDYDIEQATEELTPPNKRKTTNLALLGVPGNKLQFLHDLFFDYYGEGSTAPDWDGVNTYAYLDQVKYVDESVYQCINPAGITSTDTPNVDTDNWIKVLNTFVGVIERAKYTGQTIMLEYILNKLFNVPPITLPFVRADQSTQIWIENQFNSDSQFWLSNGGNGALTSFMGKKKGKYFLGEAYTYNQYAFIVHVPTAVDAAIAANQPAGVTAEAKIRSVLDKYVEAGRFYQYVTY